MAGFWGNEGEVEQLDLWNPTQKKQYEQFANNPITNDPLYQSGSSYLQRILNGGQNATAEFNAPYMQQFQQQVVPGLSERFAGMGTGAGGLNSSGFNQTMAQAGSGLQSTLAQLRQQLMGQASQQALGYAQQPYSNQLSGLGLQPYENIYKQPTPGLGQSLLKGAAGGLMAYGMSGGDPMKTMAGAGAGMAGA